MSHVWEYDNVPHGACCHVLKACSTQFLAHTTLKFTPTSNTSKTQQHRVHRHDCHSHKSRGYAHNAKMVWIKGSGLHSFSVTLSFIPIATARQHKHSEKKKLILYKLPPDNNVEFHIEMKVIHSRDQQSFSIERNFRSWKFSVTRDFARFGQEKVSISQFTVYR